MTRKDSAVLEALDMFKQPARARSLGRYELPADMLDAIKIAAGDQATTDLWAESSRESQEFIRQSAVFYLQHTIANSGDDKFRTLGLPGNAGKEEIRLHKRWLLKWLHPDRNPSKWETVLFHRVSKVAEMLEASQDAAPESSGFAAIESKSVGMSSTYSPDFRYRGQRRSKKLRGPVPQVSWKNLIYRVARRVLLVALLVVLALLLIVIFGGPLQNFLQSMMTGM